MKEFPRLLQVVSQQCLPTLSPPVDGCRSVKRFTTWAFKVAPLAYPIPSYKSFPILSSRRLIPEKKSPIIQLPQERGSRRKDKGEKQGMKRKQGLGNRKRYLRRHPLADQNLAGHGFVQNLFCFVCKLPHRSSGRSER